jgi:hypothetical protein
MIRVPLAAACLALLLDAGTAATYGQPSTEWRDFAATWSLAGRRHTIPQARGAASVVDLSGAFVVTGGAALGRGFRGEVIGFDDGEGVSVGRAVWTDERGDRIFSRLTGEAIAGGRRISGTITGGTGQYADIEGEYTFTWQYVLAGEDDHIQGRAGDVAGRVRRAGPRP